MIEDTSHVIGGSYKGEKVGNGRYSDITVVSFHPVKIITTGECGMAITNDSALSAKMRKFRSYGFASTPSEMDARPGNELWNYQQLGWVQFRLTDMQVALGLF